MFIFQLLNGLLKMGIKEADHRHRSKAAGNLERSPPSRDVITTFASATCALANVEAAPLEAFSHEGRPDQ